MTDAINVSGMAFQPTGLHGEWRYGDYELRHGAGRWQASVYRGTQGKPADTPDAAIALLRAALHDRAEAFLKLRDGLLCPGAFDLGPEFRATVDRITTRERDYYRDVLESLQRKIDKALTAPEG